MIQCNKLTKSYGSRTLFTDASFTLSKGERCGIVGRNGAGKTTLFRLLLGQEEVDSGEIVAPKHYRIKTLPQHVAFSEKDIVQETLLGLPEERREEKWRAERILDGLGFSCEEYQKAPTHFSGGYQLRIQLAKSLIGEPDCLLLDEPTNYLDIVAIRWLEKTLSHWHGELLVISHDKTFLDQISTHILGIYRGQITKYPGTVEKYYEQMLLQDAAHEKTREKQEKKRAHLKSFVDRFGAKASKAKQAQSKLKTIQNIEKMPVMEQLAAVQNLNFSFKEAPFLGKRCLECTQLGFSYPDSLFSIHNFSLDVKMGDRIAIAGKNGRGKSTLLSLIGGFLSPQTGSRWISPNLCIGYFGQTHIDRLTQTSTVFDEIQRANPLLTTGDIKSLCGQMLFSGDDSQKKICNLSGGEKSRVLLGKILASPCNCLLLDEPTHHLDMESCEALLEAIQRFQGPVFLVTHDETLLNHFAEKFILCQKDHIEIFEGKYSVFLEKKGWDEPAPPKPKKQESAQKNLYKKRLEVRKTSEKVMRDIEREEKKLAETEKKLVQASVDGNPSKIKELSHTRHAIETKISELFQKLEESEVGF